MSTERPKNVEKGGKSVIWTESESENAENSQLTWSRCCENCSNLLAFVSTTSKGLRYFSELQAEGTSAASMQSQQQQCQLSILRWHLADKLKDGATGSGLFGEKHWIGPWLLPNVKCNSFSMWQFSSSAFVHKTGVQQCITARSVPMGHYQLDLDKIGKLCVALMEYLLVQPNPGIRWQSSIEPTSKSEAWFYHKLS